jgi:hypothetical protein
MDGSDPAAFLPEPQSLKKIAQLPPSIRDAWLRAYRAELQNMISLRTFGHPTRYRGERCLPIRAVFKTKLRSDGKVDKLKVRIAIRGDLDQGAMEEDNSAPLASFRLLKVFLSEASRLQKRVYQADFIGAYLQAKMNRITMYVYLSNILNSFQILQNGLEYWKNRHTESTPPVDCGLRNCLDGIPSTVSFNQKLIQLYSAIEKAMSGLFYSAIATISLTLHPLLPSEYNSKQRCVGDLIASCLANYIGSYRRESPSTKTSNITLDQSRYAAAMCARFLPQSDILTPTDKDVSQYAAPLPNGTIFTKADCSTDFLSVRMLQEEFQLDYPVVIGCLLWIPKTFPRLQFPIRKLAKYMRLTGKMHFRALLHLLHHIRCHHLCGLTFYSEVTEAPVSKMLFEQGVDPVASPCYVFADSLWQDCLDTGRSTGGYHIFLQGGIVDSAMTFPVPVALSSAKAVYNNASAAAVAAQALSMLIQDIFNADHNAPQRIPMLLDNKACISMGESFRDTKHNRHIMRCYHVTWWMVADQYIVLFWIPAKFQLADPVTKCLTSSSPMFYSVLWEKQK